MRVRGEFRDALSLLRRRKCDVLRNRPGRLPVACGERRGTRGLRIGQPRTFPLSSTDIAMVVHLVPALFTADDGLIGGAERYVFELARHMADMVPTSLVTF